MLTRRSFLKSSGQLALLPVGFQAITLPELALDSSERSAGRGSVRCINIVNFIRGVEPRFATDLLLPVQKQVESILKYGLPATWLLQFDALVSGPFVEFLKGHLGANHEVGFWFEMNEELCKAAEVLWRGRTGFEWDSHPPVAFTIGYSPSERVKLADAAMKAFKSVWGRYPRSVASWNLDSFTIAYLSEHYDIEAFAVCRDQIATDGFTIWGGPIAGYYPSKMNCWSPAVEERNQIHTPVFRMLGQDPVHYYDNGYRLPDGRTIHEPDTMEPVWTSGRSRNFVKEFLGMIEDGVSLGFAYAQLGQENSFSWPDMEEGYAPQMAALAEVRDRGRVHVETMSESGRRFKQAFRVTPVQAQIQLEDPFRPTGGGESTMWYQSRFYRANLHIKDSVPYFRDITIYGDLNPQPFLTQATRLHEVEQRMPAILDGYHWSKVPGNLSEIGSGGFFYIGNKRLSVTGPVAIRETDQVLTVTLPIQQNGELTVRFEEDQIRVSVSSGSKVSVSFEWDPTKSSLVEVRPDRARYRWQDFDYGVVFAGGEAHAMVDGFKVTQTQSDLLMLFRQ